MTEFYEVTQAHQITDLAALAKEIWREYYMPLLGEAQISYMLNKFQEEHVLHHQIAENQFRYFFLNLKNQTAGYIGVQTEHNSLFLSKLYVKEAFRGQGIGRDAMSFLEGWARGAQLGRIWLTVNRGNTASIHAYEKLGFRNIGMQDADIGSGYVMDDYIFEKRID